ncbi:hypothetical protein ATANTOWER_019910 [Ataeniobius toweri]|uniref:Uncharacterized protein n=1 Tax=Ataeniobius toweri TaxID=208326 RepID=A0ABU7B7L1_9TELE|nr:hypothetical protein [Ataeniobius toweri]
MQDDGTFRANFEHHRSTVLLSNPTGLDCGLVSDVFRAGFCVLGASELYCPNMDSCEPLYSISSKQEMLVFFLHPAFSGTFLNRGLLSLYLHMLVHRVHVEEENIHLTVEGEIWMSGWHTSRVFVRLNP